MLLLTSNFPLPVTASGRLSRRCRHPAADPARQSEASLPSSRPSRATAPLERLPSGRNNRWNQQGRKRVRVKLAVVSALRSRAGQAAAWNDRNSRHV